MPGLVRGMARTAAVVGTAGAVNHHQQKKWAAKDQQAAQAAAYQQQQYAPPPPQYAEPQYAPAPQYAPPPPAAEVDPTVEKIDQFADLHSQGILSDEEFAAAKAKALGIKAAGPAQHAGGAPRGASPLARPATRAVASG